MLLEFHVHAGKFMADMITNEMTIPTLLKTSMIRFNTYEMVWSIKGPYPWSKSRWRRKLENFEGTGRGGRNFRLRRVPPRKLIGFGPFVYWIWIILLHIVLLSFHWFSLLPPLDFSPIFLGILRGQPLNEHVPHASLLPSVINISHPMIPVYLIFSKNLWDIGLHNIFCEKFSFYQSVEIIRFVQTGWGHSEIPICICNMIVHLGNILPILYSEI